jgi:hypothetical protein
VKFNILVIDDSAPERRKSYEVLAMKASAAARIELVLHFLERPEELPRVLQERVYGLVFVDAVLTDHQDRWPKNFDFRWVLSTQLESRFPFVIVSSQWDNINSAEMNTGWKDPQCRGFFHWRDIQSGISCVTPGDFAYAVAQLNRIVCDLARVSKSTDDLAPDTSLSIVHVSDLQIGGFDPKRLALEATLFAEAIRARLGGRRPSFLALTGDITQTGQPEEFAKAYTWLELFCRNLGFDHMPRERILLCAGNHDVNLCLAGAARITVGKNAASRKIELRLGDIDDKKGLLEFALRPYKDFAARVAEQTFIDDDTWVETRFRHLGVAFYGLQTITPNAYTEPAREVRADSLQKVWEHISSMIPDGEPMPLVIGMGHHCPVEARPAEGVDNVGDLTTFFGSKRVPTALFLYGHVHQARQVYLRRGDIRLLSFAAPSPTMGEAERYPDTFRGISLYEFPRAGGQVKSIKCCSYAWVAERLTDFGTSETYTLGADRMFRDSE